MTWGGARAGAGRKPKPLRRIGRTFRLTDEEFEALRPLIVAIKARNDEYYKRKKL